MEAVGPDATTTPEHSADGLRQANGETLDSARERGDAVRLDRQVHVVGLHAEMHDSKPALRGGREAAPQTGGDVVRAQ